MRKWKILLLLIVRAKLFHKMVASYSCMSVQSKHAQTFSYLFLKILTEGAVMKEAGCLFQYSLPLLPAKTLALTFEYLVGVSSKAASKGVGKKQV